MSMRTLTAGRPSAVTTCRRSCCGALHIDLDGHVLVIALPHGVAVRRRPLPEHVMRTSRRFPALETGSFPAGQVPADRPVQRGERRHRGCVRIVGRPLHQLGVDSGGVPAPQRQQPSDLRGDREMRRLHPGEAMILPGSGPEPSRQTEYRRGPGRPHHRGRWRSCRSSSVPAPSR